jgi:hypothetical protein
MALSDYKLNGAVDTGSSIPGKYNDLIDEMQAELDARDLTIAAKVALTGNETVAGIKTFSSSPVIPAPTTDLQPATKKYVDDLIASYIISGDPVAKSNNTAYLAETAGMVVASRTVGSSGYACRIYGYIGASSGSLSIIARGSGWTGEVGSPGIASISFIVKKGAYWKVDGDNTAGQPAGTTEIYWTPIGE